jgi:nicotinamide-nucleotide amidase
MLYTARGVSLRVILTMEQTNTMTVIRPAGVALLMTGDELMRGDTVDSNSAHIAQALTERGVVVREKTTVGDDRDLLLETIARLAKDHDVLIINGGLGPTSDDLTAEVVAQLANTPLKEHPDARSHVEAWCQRLGVTPNESNLKQAKVPFGAALIDNPTGSAMGFSTDIYRCRVITTPGVPRELKAMMASVLTLTSERITTQNAHTRRLQTFGIGESTIQQLLNDSELPWPPSVNLGFRAGMPQLELKLTVNNEDDLPQQQHCFEQLSALFGDHILGEGDTTLASALQQTLRAQGKTVTAAESCTGGLIASMITREPGSSAVFNAGYVTYANASKRDTLGVSQEDLDKHGAVSEPVVRQMLAGALERSGADIGIAVSGIAGPSGGTDDKPVGTVWLAWGSQDAMQSHCVVIPGSRDLFQNLVAAAGLDLMRRQLLALPPQPHYFTRRTE